MNEEKLRQEFEAWHRKIGYVNAHFDTYPSGGYKDLEMRYRWGGYKAAASSRDELIRKLVTYFKEIATGKNAAGEKVDFPVDIALTALVAARVQGYGG